MLNPITYTEAVVGDFLRYQLTTYPFADDNLHGQMRSLLNLEETRNTPLLQGPDVSLSQSFKQGAALSALVNKGVLHPHLLRLSGYSHAYGHQQQAFEAIHRGQTTLVATGTGSGKTECFLYPIISHCLHLRDRGAAPGIVAVLVYPMNALAEDQLGRLRGLLAGTGVSFGMYVGKTPERTSDASGVRLHDGASRQDYLAEIEKAQREKQTHVICPAEERVSREEMRATGQHPRILLTNVKQLELLLTRQRDVELFDDADLRFLVFDEAHTFSGAQGSETACLIRRLRRFCRKRPEQVVCVATSATIADPVRGVEAGREFASRFFGVDEAGVELVGESHEADSWAAERKLPSPLPGDPAVQLKTVLETLVELETDEPSASAVQGFRRMFQSLTGTKLDAKDWQESLYARLAENEVAYQIAQALIEPKALAKLCGELAKRIGRAVPEEEILVWLALGAVSRHQGRPLLRPVIHGFIRGMSGAVTTFPSGRDGPRLWLSREEALADEQLTGDENQLRKLDLTTCTTCGQHYFVHFAADFQFTAREPSGGVAEGDVAYWPALDEVRGGKRLVLTDRVVGGEEDDGDGDDGGDVAPSEAPNRTAYVFFCRFCGALHRNSKSPCLGCGRADELVSLLAIQQHERHPGHLSTCVSCGAYGRRFGSNYREPARPVRAITVSDVHVLAQNMLHNAERKRLIVFADNRQDAAFQAGWMQDHARRYRLRALMFERIMQGPTSIGDLVSWLDKRLERDPDLSKALIPEVWRVARFEQAGSSHAEERRFFLRIQALREATNGLRQRIGLEPWGRLRARYLGLEASLPLFQKWAHEANCTPEALLEAAASLLDIARRSSVVYDREHEILTRWWNEGDPEVNRGYIQPVQGGPKALVLERELDHAPRLRQWLSKRGQTRAVQLAKKWGFADDQVRPFLEELWKLLTEELELLVPVILRNRWNKPLPGSSGGRQIDGDKLVLEEHRGRYRCRTCRRTQLRRGPHDRCIQWRCSGTVEFLAEDPDNYDLKVLDETFTLVRAREHSAQVPVEDREMLERAFKGTGEYVNTLVATPTLELGVDIGSLDAVLMRNVPPLAANYWQRAGRAGRRHRMAVNITYAGSKSHDRAYFNEPLKLLGGRIDPPRFNLQNVEMVRKHVHAAVMSELHQLARATRGLPEAEREAIGAGLAHVFPEQIRGYLFIATGELRRGDFNLAPLYAVIEAQLDPILEYVGGVFSDCWPHEDRAVVSPERLREYVLEMPARLLAVIDRLERRLVWALGQLERLDGVRRRMGTLDPAEDAMRNRCDRLIKRLKGVHRRRRGEAEGYDDTLTYSVLAAEGFLPGYGLETGSVLAYHQAPRHASDLRDFQLRRGLSMALREYSPGNFIYANGHRFYPRFYHFQAVSLDVGIEALQFQVDIANEAVTEQGGVMQAAAGLGASILPAVMICDVDLPHQSHIADDEDYRFQLSVAIYGYEQGRHGGGRAYRWGALDVHVRSQVHLRLVNVGPRRTIADGGGLGYPVCLVCGQSRSPFASQAERDNFSQTHLGRCGQPVNNVGFYADDIADALTLVDCTDKTQAYSVAEALRMGAAEILEMERDDLQILVVSRAGSEKVNALLYDPMSGGSGLLDQMTKRWGEVVAAARRIVAGCPSCCEVSCIDCLQHYRNAWAHSYLNRHVAVDCFDTWGDRLHGSHPIPPKLPENETGPLPASEAEAALAQMLERAGFPAPHGQYEIDLGMPHGKTVPDFFYEDPTERYEGLCIYVDGLSDGIHGNVEAQRRDARIREQLRAEEHEVVVIPASHLADRVQMAQHLGRIARFLLGKQRAKLVKTDMSWFVEPQRRAVGTVEGADGGQAERAEWDELLEYVDERWHGLFGALRDRSLPAPDEVGWDLRVDERVVDAQALAVWRPDGEWFALVPAEVAAKFRIARLLGVTVSADVESVAAWLTARLAGTGERR